MPVDTVYEGGSRLYFDTARPTQRYPGVTSVIDMLPKPWLPGWYAREAAKLAVAAHRSGALAERLTDEGSDHRAAMWLAGAAPRYNKLRRNVGTEAHDTVFEPLMAGTNPGRLSADMRPYAKHFRAFLAAVAPVHHYSEHTAWSDTYGYAGRFDELMTVYLDSFGRPTPDHSGKAFACLADWKTSKDPHAEVSLQLAAYRRADFMITPTGERRPMPKLDKALMLHITPAGWNLYPVRADETDFEVFRGLLDGFRAAQRWQGTLAKSALGDPIAGG